MGFGIRNVSSLYEYREVSLTAAPRELARYKLDLVSVQEVRWEKGGRVKAGDYNFSMVKEKKIINLEQDLLHHKIISSVRRKKFFFFCDRTSYIVLRGRLCNIIVLNVHATSEEESDDLKDRYCEELD